MVKKLILMHCHLAIPYTPSDGLKAEVIEVQSLDEVESLGREKIKGKIVFYNRPMDPTKIRTFSAYGGAVDQRVYGASKAAEYGAVAALVRSITANLDDFPHTGLLVYKDTLSKIPRIAITTNDEEMLSARLKQGKIKVYAKTNCRKIGLSPAPTVIGEIKGSEFPDEIIVVGGHLDSWDVGQGAHDDGAGCAQAMEVLRIFQAAVATTTVTGDTTVPTASASNDGPLTCTKTSVTLTANPATGVTYSWSGGGTNRTKTVTSAGAYTVTVTESNGCTATATTTVTLSNSGLSVNAGTSFQICTSDDKIEVLGTSSGTSAVAWTSTGTGTFTSGNALKATYILSNADKA